MALFRSRYSNFTQNIRPSSRVFHPVTGVEISMTPAIRANFGIVGDETIVIDPETGQEVPVADIHGGFFDSESAQDTHGWTDDERETVEQVLRNVARDRPDYVQEVIPVHVPASEPWLNYNDTDYKVVADVAKATGNVGNAILYERENLNRAAVLAALMTALNDLPDEQGIDELAKTEPRQEIPADMLKPQGSAVGTLKVGNSKKGIKTNDQGAVVDTPGLQLKNPATILLD